MAPKIEKFWEFSDTAIEHHSIISWSADEGEFVETTKQPAPRTPLHIQVEFRRSYARGEANGILKNISITGAFLQHGGESLRAGEKLHLKFIVSGRERDVQAMVIWVNGAGSGIKFLPMNNRDVQIVDDLIYFVEAKRTDSREILDTIFKKVA
jgi:hypothetical protein